MLMRMFLLQDPVLSGNEPVNWRKEQVNWRKEPDNWNAEPLNWNSNQVSFSFALLVSGRNIRYPYYFIYFLCFFITQLPTFMGERQVEKIVPSRYFHSFTYVFFHLL